MTSTLIEPCTLARGKNRLPAWWWIAVLALWLTRMALVSCDEIELRYSDDFGYAISASQFYFGAPYQQYSYARQPVYPLFISLSQATGVPARLMIEFVWLAASLCVSSAVRFAGLSVLSSLVTLALAMFTPMSFWLFNRMLPDGLYGACVLVLVSGLACVVLAECRKNAWVWGVLAGGGGALAVNTRQETPLVYGLVALCAVLVLMLSWRAVPWRGGLVRTRLLAGVLTPVLMIIGLTHALSAANWMAIGLYAPYDLSPPGYRSLYKELLAIPVPSPRIDLPVPRAARDIAYTHSPTFRALQDQLDGNADPTNPYRAACKSVTGVDGEFGAWTIWGLRRAAWRSNNYAWKSAGELDAMYAKAANELRAAARAGKYDRQRVLHEYLPPQLDQLFERLPASIGFCLQVIEQPVPTPTPPDKLTAAHEAMFNAVAARRSGNSLIKDFKHRARSGETGTPRYRRLHKAQRELIHLMQAYVLPVSYAAACVLCVLSFSLLGRLAENKRARAVLVIGSLVLAAIVSRALLFAVLDANGVYNQSRYMFITSVLLTLTIPLAIEGLVAVCARSHTSAS